VCARTRVCVRMWACVCVRARMCACVCACDTTAGNPKRTLNMGKLEIQVLEFGVSLYFEIVVKSHWNVAFNFQYEKFLQLSSSEKISNCSFLDSDQIL
jgi:hypothetical protein